MCAQDKIRLGSLRSKKTMTDVAVIQDRTVLHPKPLTILIFEQDEALLRLGAQAFSAAPRYRILSANAPSETFGRLGKEPDLVLLGIHLTISGMDCVTLVRVIREEGFSGIICIVTEEASSNRLFEAAVAGADGYIARGGHCDLPREIDHFFSRRSPFRLTEPKNDIEENLFLRSIGLTKNQRVLLGRYAELGFPRVKELANLVKMSETSLWKRLERIRNRLGLDSMSQVAHLLTALSLLRANLNNSFRRCERMSQVTC